MNEVEYIRTEAVVETRAVSEIAFPMVLPLSCLAGGAPFRTFDGEYRRERDGRWRFWRLRRIT